MKRYLLNIIAVILCLCALLTFVACGKDTPAQADDDITPPADEPSGDEPTTNETTEPETPAEPEQPGKPEQPTEPNVPTEPGQSEQPEDPEQPTEPETPAEPEITWDAEGYQNIVDNYENKALAVYGNKAMVATNDKVQLFYVEYENTTPVMKKYKEFDFSVQKLLVNEYAFGFITTDGDLYQYVTFADGHENGQPTKIMENVKNAVIGRASGMAVKNDGTLWGWENDRIIGTQVFYSLGEPYVMEEGIKNFLIDSRHLVIYVYTVNDEYYNIDYSSAKSQDVKRSLGSLKIKTDNALWDDDTKLLDFVEQGAKNNGYLFTNNTGELWFLKFNSSSDTYDKTILAENCLYIPQYETEEYPVCYIDIEHNLWMISTSGEKKLVDTDVAYVPAITSHLWYVKNDNTVWVDGKYVMDMENTIPTDTKAAEEPEITVAEKPQKASYADTAAKAIADVALGKAKFFDTATKTYITVDEYGKQEGEQKSFYVMDIDQDGAAEIILRTTSLPPEKNILVLHYDGNQVNGYRVVSGDWRYLRYNGIAANYDEDTLLTAYFKNYEMVIERVAEKKLDEQWNLYRYYVNGEETAKENYALQFKIWEAQEYITFYELSEENIEKEFINEKLPEKPVNISPEAAKEAIRDVLLGKAQFYYDYDKRYTTLPEERVRREALLNEGEDRPDYYSTYSYDRFALVDLDGDGATECVIETSMYSAEGYKVLYFDGEKVIMYSTTFRGWRSIKVDGTAYGSGVIVTYFEDGKMMTKNLCAYVNAYPGVDKYYVNGYPADRHEYVNAESENDNVPYVDWYDITEKEITQKLGNIESDKPTEPETPTQPETPVIPTSPSDI